MPVGKPKSGSQLDRDPGSRVGRHFPILPREKRNSSFKVEGYSDMMALLATCLGPAEGSSVRPCVAASSVPLPV